VDELARPRFNNPLDLETVDRGLALIDSGPDGRILDVGCGRGEMLARALESRACRGVGVDSSEGEIAHARRRLAALRDRVVLHARRIQDVPLEPAHFDAALCVGASHAFGTGAAAYPAALAALTLLVRPGGLLLVGEGFWRRDPEPAYLAATGIVADGLGDGTLTARRRRRRWCSAPRRATRCTPATPTAPAAEAPGS
jgi:cyclopropane fatty-acyl-phospholipid synthase-like methyltransferase